MKPLFLLSLIGLTILNSAVHAQTFIGRVKFDIPESAAYGPCINKAASRDAEMAACTMEEAARWDRQLNTAYARLRVVLPKDEFSKLQAFQRLWIGDRDASCKPNPNGGTMDMLITSGCQLRFTAVRAFELEQRLARMEEANP
jgi:uncharacterized protein YecT (DUF1311 family)